MTSGRSVYFQTHNDRYRHQEFLQESPNQLKCHGLLDTGLVLLQPRTLGSGLRLRSKHPGWNVQAHRRSFTLL